MTSDEFTTGSERIKQNAIVLVLRIIVLSVVFNIFYLVISLAGDYFDAFNNGHFINTITYDTLTYLILMVVQFGIMILLVMRWYNNQFFIKEGFLIEMSGVIFKNEKRIPMSGIQTINLEQSFFGKIFSYGTIELKTSNQSHKINLYAVAEPEQVMGIFRKHA